MLGSVSTGQSQSHGPVLVSQPQLSNNNYVPVITSNSTLSQQVPAPATHHVNLTDYYSYSSYASSASAGQPQPQVYPQQQQTNNFGVDFI